MIDLHSHVLPNLDDGAPDWETTLAMLAQAAMGGTETIVATPHTYEAYQAATVSREVLALTAQANERARQAGLTIEVLPGHECMIDSDLLDALRGGQALTLGGSRAVLLELPFALWPPFIESLIFDLQVAGYTVLLAHPERYHAVQDDPNLLLPLVESGVLTQVTSTSIEGRFGAKARDTARQLLEHGLAHVLASDAHTTRGRNPRLDGARDIATDWVGREAARRLVLDTPRALLRDEPIALPEPQRVEGRRKLFGWL